MKLFYDLSIKSKLIFIILIITVPSIIIGFTIAIAYTLDTQKKEMIYHANVNAKLIGEYCVTPLAFQDSTGAERVLNRLESVPNIVCGLLFDEKNAVFAQYHQSHSPEKKLPEIKSSSFFHNGYLHVFQPVNYMDYFYGTIYLKVSTANLVEKGKRSVATMVCAMLILVGASCVLAWRLQKVVSDPILKLTEVTKAISNEADLSLRLNQKGTDELGMLFNGFNTMLDQIHTRERERDQALHEIRCSLKEKEVMLKEIHHRVKNNLQVISSLLSLQARHIEDKASREMFIDCQNRVRSMALVHEKLYESHDLASIDFSEYIESLLEGLYRSYHIEPGKNEINMQVQNVKMSIDLAVPCGLVIHELVSNAMKHAFREMDEGQGEIDIILLYQKEKSCIDLTIKDNGIGISTELDFRKTDSLGLRLAVILVEDQLKGEINLERGQGTAFHIRFNPGNSVV